MAKKISERQQKVLDAAEWHKKRDEVATADIEAQLNKPHDERSVKLTSDEYAGLLRLLNIEYPIAEAANWVVSQMDMESKQEKAKEEKLHGWGIEKGPFNFRMDKPLVDALDAVAKEKGLKRSDAVRQALIAYLEIH